jgi:hypothetical protein
LIAITQTYHNHFNMCSKVLKLALLGVFAIKSNDLGVVAFPAATFGLNNPQTSTNTYLHRGIAPFGQLLPFAQGRIGPTDPLEMKDSPEEAEKRSKRQILKANIKKIITYPKVSAKAGEAYQTSKNYSVLRIF